ncbi:MAG: hypothetical protein KDA85_03905 [Planctomycetaceae bacterium]|nr:hypothetical protein [Planctomycetaceae bacterium]
MMNSLTSSFRTWFTAILLIVAAAQAVEAQTSRDRRDQASPQDLERRLEKAEESLLKEYMDVASELYKQDAKEESLAVLERIHKINPKLSGLKEEMEKVREELMSANEIDTEINTSKGWGTAIAVVTEGKPIRIQAAGDYKLTLTSQVPLTGLPTEDSQTDHSKAAPFGALMGIVVTDGKPGEPFPVNSGIELTPKKSGQLFLRVNVPVTARCSGEIKVRVSGGGLTDPNKRR